MPSTNNEGMAALILQAFPNVSANLLHAFLAMHYYATYLLADRITSNAIAPALIASDMVKAMKLPSVEAFPRGRLGQPDEIWPAVRMILETEYMTGQTIHINAGRYMT